MRRRVLVCCLEVAGSGDSGLRSADELAGLGGAALAYGRLVSVRSSSAERFVVGAAASVEELEGDPHALLARLREREPVSWLPALGGWLVTRRDLALRVMRDARTFTVDDARFSGAPVVPVGDVSG
jgi:hypothetical protein